MGEEFRQFYRYQLSDLAKSRVFNFTESRNLKFYHFTSSTNLTSILQRGLYPRRLIPANAHGVEFGDALRVSLHGATCLSVGWPNYKMMASKSLPVDPCAKFVILELDPAFLIQTNWLAFPTNSSRLEITEALKVNPKQFAASGGLAKLFADNKKTRLGRLAKRGELMLGSGDPTDPQAEIAVDDIIEPYWINAIFIGSTTMAKQVAGLLPDTSWQSKLTFDPYRFGPRQDYTFWKNDSLKFPIESKDESD